MKRKTAQDIFKIKKKKKGAIAISYPPRVRVRATVKLSATFFHDESSITKGGYESAIAPKKECKEDWKKKEEFKK